MITALNEAESFKSFRTTTIELLDTGDAEIEREGAIQ